MNITFSLHQARCRKPKPYPIHFSLLNITSSKMQQIPYISFLHQVWLIKRADERVREGLSCERERERERTNKKERGLGLGAV
jgi:hypothetical protein